MNGELVPRTPVTLDRRRQREWDEKHREQALRVSSGEVEIAVSAHLSRMQVEARAQVASATLNAGHMLTVGEAHRIVERHKAKGKIRNPDALAAIDELFAVADMGAQNAIFRLYSGQ